MKLYIPEIMSHQSPEELLEASKVLVKMAKTKKHEIEKQSRKDAFNRNLEEKKIMTVLKREEKQALWEKAKVERRSKFAGNVHKNDVISFIAKGNTYVGRVTKTSAFDVKVNAASAGIFHQYDPELTIEYGFITSVQR